MASMRHRQARGPGATERARGFTLIELMVTIAVLAIIAAIAYPNMTSLFNSSRLAGSANDLTTDFQYARSEAIRRNARITLCASGDGATCGGTWQNWIVVDEAGTAPDNVLRVGHAKGTLVVSASPTIVADDNRIVFRADGMARRGNGNLLSASLATCIATNAPADNLRAIHIRAGSRATVEKANGGGACDAPAD